VVVGTDVRAPLQLVRVSCPVLSWFQFTARSRALRIAMGAMLKVKKRVFHPIFLYFRLMDSKFQMAVWQTFHGVCVPLRWPYRGRHPEYIYPSSFTRVVLLE